MKRLIITKKESYTIIQLNGPRANAINLEMVEELRTTIADLESDPKVRGVIITGKPKYFSVGLDLIDLYSYDEEKIAKFFRAFGTMYIELAHFSKPLIAAITGHAPAGGAVIALTCDYRILAEGEVYGIGLNEVAVDIQISDNIIHGYAFWLGYGKATKYLLEGKLLRPHEALESGFADEVVPLDEVLAKAEQQITKYLQADETIFKTTKLKCRKVWLDQLEEENEDTLREALEIWWNPEIRSKLKTLVESINNRKKLKLAQKENQ